MLTVANVPEAVSHASKSEDTVQLRIKVDAFAYDLAVVDLEFAFVYISPQFAFTRAAITASALTSSCCTLAATTYHGVIVRCSGLELTAAQASRSDASTTAAVDLSAVEAVFSVVVANNAG